MSPDCDLIIGVDSFAPSRMSLRPRRVPLRERPQGDIEKLSTLFYIRTRAVCRRGDANPEQLPSCSRSREGQHRATTGHDMRHLLPNDITMPNSLGKGRASRTRFATVAAPENFKGVDGQICNTTDFRIFAEPAINRSLSSSDD